MDDDICDRYNIFKINVINLSLKQLREDVLFTDNKCNKDQLIKYQTLIMNNIIKIQPLRLQNSLYFIYKEHPKYTHVFFSQLGISQHALIDTNFIMPSLQQCNRIPKILEQPLIQYLPLELLVKIIGTLSIEDIRNLRCTCHYFNDICYNDIVWQQLYENHYHIQFKIDSDLSWYQNYIEINYRDFITKFISYLPDNFWYGIQSISQGGKFKPNESWMNNWILLNTYEISVFKDLNGNIYLKLYCHLTPDSIRVIGGSYQKYETYSIKLEKYFMFIYHSPFQAKKSSSNIGYYVSQYNSIKPISPLFSLREICQYYIKKYINTNTTIREVNIF